MKKTFTTFLFVAFVAAQFLAQTSPNFLSPLEISQIEKGNYKPPVSAGITEPPNFSPRAMAEWEELQALVISWNGFNAILAEIVRAARLETKVVICCNSQSVVDAAKTYLTSKNVDISSNVDFLIAANNSIWVRDYGPNTIYQNAVDSGYIVDWIYNRNRPADDLVSEKVATHLGLQTYSTSVAPYDLVNTGGNFMSDGMGQAFASKLIFTNNDHVQNGECGNLFDLFGTSDHPEAEIDDIMLKFMGIKNYIKMDRLPYDCIHHIDMHMKLIDEETLLVGEYPAGVADGPQIEANLQYILSNYKSAFGTPYNVVRVPMPPEGNVYPDQNGDYRTYANATFVNKTILVPFYQQQFDTTARRIWETAMPGYKIVGINCNQIIPSLGAIHCITKEIGVNDPMRIVHQKLRDVADPFQPGYPVFATIQHRTGIAGSKVFWKNTIMSNWETVEMSSVIDSPNVWSAVIPQQQPGMTVHYFIEGNSKSGRSRNHPLPAPEGFLKFKIAETSTAAQPENLILEKIYPNPSNSITVVPVELNRKLQVVARVFDVLGKNQLEIFNGELPSGKSNLFLNAAELAPGTYFVEIISGGQRNVGKLIVK